MDSKPKFWGIYTVAAECYYICTPTRHMEKSPAWSRSNINIPLHTHTYKKLVVRNIATTYPHLQDSTSPGMWVTINTNATTYPHLDKLVAGVGDYTTPTRLDKCVGDYKHQCHYIHLQDSINKSLVWGITPTRLDKQVASVGDYKHPTSRLDKGVGDLNTNATI